MKKYFLAEHSSRLLFNSQGTPSLGEFPKPVFRRTHWNIHSMSIKMKDGDPLQLCCEFECLTFHENIWRFLEIYDLVTWQPHFSDVWLKNYFLSLLSWIFMLVYAAFSHINNFSRGILIGWRLKTDEYAQINKELWAFCWRVLWKGFLRDINRCSPWLIFHQTEFKAHS